MKQWVIPYIDQTPEFWQDVSRKFGDYIQEVYFPLPGNITGTGRGLQANQYLLPFLNTCSLPKAVLINPIVLQETIDQIGHVIIEALATLQDEFGVLSVVVTHPGLARLVKQELPRYKVTASVLMGIANPVQLIPIRDYVDAIVPASHLSRDVNALKQLREAFSGEIRLMVNESCLPHCIYRNQHFYEMGYGEHAPQSLCAPLLQEQAWMRLTGAWILPQHLHYFDGLYDSLKLAGRVTLQNPEKYFKVLNAYIQREKLLPSEIGGGPASVLAPIDIPDTLFKHILNCDKQCHRCSVCKKYYEQATGGQLEAIPSYCPN